MPARYSERPIFFCRGEIVCARQKTNPPSRFARHLALHKGGKDGGDVSINFIFSIVGADSFVLPEEKRKKCTFFSIGCASGGGERC